MATKLFNAAARKRIVADLRREKKKVRGVIVDDDADRFVGMLENLASEIRVSQRSAKLERRDLEATRRAIANAEHRIGLLSRYAVAHIVKAALPIQRKDDFRAQVVYARRLLKLVEELKELGVAVDLAATLVRSKRKGSDAFPELDEPRALLARGVVDIVRLAGLKPSSTKDGFAARCLKEVFALAGAKGNPNGYIALVSASKPKAAK